MQDLLEFVAHYGYGLVFLAIFIEQMGIPLPGVPILVVMGAMARTGEFEFLGVVGSALAGSLAADLIWYQLGRRYGRAVLNLMCRISLEPDYCVRRAEDAFAKRGVWTLLFVKFIPGLNAAAVPLAGMIRIPGFRFLAFDASGILLWSGAYVSLGYIFSREIELILQRISAVGGLGFGGHRRVRCDLPVDQVLPTAALPEFDPGHADIRRRTEVEDRFGQAGHLAGFAEYPGSRPRSRPDPRRLPHAAELCGHRRPGNQSEE